MSEQALDLKRPLRIVGRHRLLVSAVAVLGLAGGAGYGSLHPPLVHSEALVVLPAPTHDINTDVVMAVSDPVLRGALPHIRPATTLLELRHDVRVKSITANIISFTAPGKTAAQSEVTANAVAASFLQLANAGELPVPVTIPASKNGPEKKADLLNRATNASGLPKTVALIIYALLGALLGVVLGTIAAFLISKSDRRLRERDEIADAVGIPVLAAVPVVHPSDATGWAKLLAEYDPGPVHAWRLRKVLQHLGLNEVSPTDPDNVASLAVLSLSSDPGAVALGPQLAVVAASLGIRTALVIGPQQDPNTTATLRAACTVTSATSPIWSRNLQVSVRDHSHLRDQLDVALNIVVVVVDAQAPEIEQTTATAVTVLGVSAGAATAEDLARVAVSAAADGRQLAGILVADPDRMDKTTGRMDQPTRHASRKPPLRLDGRTREAGR
jgi:capsular polysaccharide biosynthesis protein